jgi:hypothetical protein
VTSGIVLGRKQGRFPLCFRKAQFPQDRPRSFASIFKKPSFETNTLDLIKASHDRIDTVYLENLGVEETLSKADFGRVAAMFKAHDEDECDCANQPHEKLDHDRTIWMDHIFSHGDPSDWICILFGASSPAILQPNHCKVVLIDNPEIARESIRYDDISSTPCNMFHLVCMCDEDNEKSGAAGFFRRRFLKLSNLTYDSMQEMGDMEFIYGNFVIR